MFFLESELYYITNTATGKYYKRGKNNNLIKAKNKTDAAKFTLIEAKDYVANNEYIYSIINVDSGKDIKDGECIQENIEQKEDKFNVDWEELLEKLYDISSNIDTYEKNVKEKMSDIDKEITDILHYIEFKELSSEEKIEVVDMLQERRRVRREVKDEYNKILSARASFLNNSFKIKIKQCYNDIESMKDRHYTPRKLSKLFERSEDLIA